MASAFSVLIAGVVILLAPPRREAEALPGAETYRMYFYDEAMTQYAGEELVLSCHGRVNRMLDGERGPYSIMSSEPCNQGIGTTACESCAVYSNCSKEDPTPFCRIEWCPAGADRVVCSWN